MNVFGKEQAGGLIEDPVSFFEHSRAKVLSLPREALEALQLEALKLRFEQYRGRLPLMDRLADIQGVSEINELNDVLPLLFDAAIYKSYPPSLIEKHRYPQLTQWLGKLTTVDLSGIDASACRTIDEWLLRLKNETSLAVTHTSGTSGTMSFVPWTKADWKMQVRLYPLMFCDDFGPGFNLPMNIDCIYPAFRHGFVSHSLVNDAIVDVISGGEERLHCAYPERLSADVMLLAARRRAAAAKGKADSVKVDPEVEARLAEFVAQQRQMPVHLASFFENVGSRLAGRRVWILATPTLLLSLAEKGLAQGLRQVFATNSVINSGGGGKGVVLPDDWQAPVKEFLGVQKINFIYGMSELTSVTYGCSAENYHIPPWLIPFMLDADNKPLPRAGRVTGRAAFYDLLTTARWGGFVAGDEVTIEWDDRCPCGHAGPYYVKGSIHRWSERHASEGEEKLSCAAAPEAYAEALDFLTDTSVAA